MGTGKQSHNDHTTSFKLPLKEESKSVLFEKILKAVNDLKSGMGMIKRLPNIAKPSKPNDAQNEKKDGVTMSKMINQRRRTNFQAWQQTVPRD